MIRLPGTNIKDHCMNSEFDTTNQNDFWRRRFFDLVELVKSYSWFDERADFYQSLAAKLKEITGADSVNIRLLTPTQDSFVLYAYHGDVESAVNRQFGVLSANAGRMPHLIETGEPIVFNFANPTTNDIDWERGVDDGFSCAVIVALPGVQGIVGAADFLFHDQREWGQQEIDWLQSLGEFVGATIGNALLTDNMMSLRVADERRSLSSEIHDNVAQSASVISLEIESALDSLAHGDTDAALRNLDLIKRASSELDTSIHGELENLNTDISPNEDSSLEQVEQTISSFCDNWGLTLDMSCDERSRDVVIPKRIMVQLTRVLNEALVNVVRHARASKVSACFQANDAGLAIAIEDDGRGFDPSSVGSSHLGLRIMRERLESIDSTLEIDAKLGAGTRLDIVIPYLV